MQQSQFSYEVRERINWWLETADCPSQLPLEFTRFIALWEAFNGWARCWYSRRNGDRLLVCKIAEDRRAKQHFRELLESETACYRHKLCELKELSPIVTVNCVSTASSRSTSLDDISDLSQLLKVLYQIRCNLFHGGKSGDSRRDRCLAQLAYDVLRPLFDKIWDDPELKRRHE
jgi:hypothetical protein